MLVENQMVLTLDFGSTTLCIITHSTFAANVERDWIEEDQEEKTTN